MPKWRFHTPGWVDQDELPPEVHDAWHAWHAARAKVNLATIVDQLPDGVDPALIPYVDPTCGEVPDERTAAPIDWEGFPERVTTRFGDADVANANHHGIEDLAEDDFLVTDFEGTTLEKEHWEVRDRQDEYLEWFERHDDDGVLRSVTFVCEGYDYFSFLFHQRAGRQRVVDLYRKWTGDDSLQAEDLIAPKGIVLRRPGLPPKPLVAPGGFNPRNAHNQTKGIVHLSHAANSLGAEVALAVTSSMPRHDANRVRLDGSDDKRLMCCTGGGEPARSSDPKIAAGAYKAVNDPHAPKRFTLTDPIGLYIKSWRYESLLDPDGGAVPRDWWVVERGRDATDPSDPYDSRVLRLHLEVPAGKGIRLGELTIDEAPVTSGGQLAKLIKMHLIADVWPAPAGAPSIPCQAGCCRTDGLLEVYQNAPDCGGGEDAYPDLLVPTAATHERGSSPGLGSSRRPG